MTRYLLMGTAAALLLFSILCRFFPGMRLKRLLGETANLSVSPNTILRLMGGQTLGNVIWFYLQAFLSLYLYFAVIGMIDTASTAEELKITLADFLENRMSERLAQVKRDNDYLDEQEREVRREVESVEQAAAVRRMQEPRAAESELTELLREFLA